MSKSIRSTIDLSGVTERLTRGAQDGMRLAVEHVLTEANKNVPHDEGTLERSGSAGVLPASGNKRTGFVSYDTPYAVRQHEDMTLSHDGKGQAKWLETTLASESATVGKIVAAEMRRQTGG